MSYTYKYPHPAVASDCVIFALDGNQLKVLLIERGFEPYKGHWAFPGGYLEIDESAETGALRELREETGMTKASVHQFYTFSTPGRDPRERVISVAFFALVRMQDVCGADDAALARWFNLSDLCENIASRATPPLAFDHEEMLARACQSLLDLLRLRPETLTSQKEHFTLDELKQVTHQLTTATQKVHPPQQ